MPAPHISDRSTPNTLAAWQSAVEPATLSSGRLALQPVQRQLGRPDAASVSRQCCLNSAPVNDREKARLRASLTATSGAWLQKALPISSVGLRMDDDVIRVAVGLRLGANLCEPHMCTCGVPRGCPWHAQVGLQEKRRTSPPPRPAQQRRMACNAACPGPVLQGTGRTQPVRWEASRRGLADPLVTRPLCDLGRHVP